jgi:phosphopantetheinyl transferase
MRPTEMKENSVHLLGEQFTPAVATLQNSGDVQCSAAWALHYPQVGQVRVTMLTSATSARLPDQNQVMIWLGAPHSDAGAVREAAAPLITPEEQATALALRNASDQCASLAAHAGLRLMLGATLDVAPSSVRIHHGARGKPLLDRGDLGFSLAHTRGAVAVALARWPIGIDIERKTALPDMDMIAATTFASESRNAICAAKGVARTEMFYRFWTLGEAFTKATGLGISQGLDNIAFTPDGEPRLIRVNSPWAPGQRWRFGFC